MFGIIGLLLGVAFIIVGIYKGWGLPVVMIIGSIIVVATNGIPLGDAFATMFEGLGTMARIFMPLYLFSCMVATLYIDSGAGISLSEACLHLFAKNGSPKRQRVVAIIVILLVGALICWSVDAFLLHAAIAVCLMAITNIPRKYVVTFVMLSSTIAMCIPGHMNLNTLLDNFLPGSHMSGFWAAIVGVLFVFVASVFVISRSVEKDIAKGQSFDYGPLQPSDPAQAVDRPHPVLGLIPLVLMVVLYLGVGIDAWIVLAIGAIVSFLLFAKSLCKIHNMGIVAVLKQTIDNGIHMASMPIIMLFNSTFGYAVGMTPAVGLIANSFLGLAVNPLIAYTLMSTVVIGLCNSSAGPVTCALIAQEYFVNLVDPGALRLITIYAGTVLDSLPTNLCIVATAAWAGLSIKESYPTVFKTTVVVTALALVIVTGMLVIFPGLAAGI